RNSLTFSVSGLKQLVSSIDNEDEGGEQNEIRVFPNPTSTDITFSTALDAALYSADGARVRVVRNATSMDIRDLSAGVYYLRTLDGVSKQIVITR
ncbi:MAG: T9SS C-terminal target domain-containing protein, partial [Ignavibacteriae bacterium]